MTRTLHGRIALVALGVVLVALLGTLFFSETRLRGNAQKTESEAIQRDARMAAQLFSEPLLREAHPVELEPSVRSVGAALGARVTLFDPTGRLLADSAAPPGHPEQGQADFPEIREAIRTGPGEVRGKAGPRGRSPSRQSPFATTSASWASFELAA